MNDGVCCVSMCSCFSLGSYLVLMLSDGCSVVLAVVFSDWFHGEAFESWFFEWNTC